MSALPPKADLSIDLASPPHGSLGFPQHIEVIPVFHTAFSLQGYAVRVYIRARIRLWGLWTCTPCSVYSPVRERR